MIAARLVRGSLRHAGMVTGGAAVALLYGLFVLDHAKFDVFPEFVPPQAIVQTEAPGLTPEQVEQLVTLPIENALHGAGEVEAIRSESIQGLSVVTVVFTEGSDPYRTRQVVAERLTEAAAALPDGVQPPKLGPLTSSTMDLLKIGLTSDNLTPLALRDFAQWTLRPRLLAVPGVARITVFGGEVRQLQVQVDPARLAAHDLALEDVLTAARTAVGIRGGGFVETPNQRVLIETRLPAPTPEQLGQVPVSSSGGVPVRLDEVATVAYGPEPKFGDCLIQGRDGVLLTLSSQYGANTLVVTHAVEAALAELAPSLAAQGVTLYPPLHRPARFIVTALAGIRDDLLLGALLIAGVLFLFLRKPSAVLVSLATLPLSLLATVAILDRLGWTINTMTLGGMAVALGVVVDDAIIDVENIVRRLRSRNAQTREEIVEVVYAAALEVRAPVVYATFVVALVLVPVLFLSGIQGSFFAPLAAAFIIATVVSLLVALTVTPAMALVFLTRVRLPDEPRWITRLKNLHQRGLAALSRHPRWALALAFVIAGVSVAALPFFGNELMPAFREGHFVAQLTAPPGTSLAAKKRTGVRISAELLAIPGIRTVSEQIGRAEAGEDTWGPHRSELHIELEPLSGREEERVLGEIEKVLAGYPGLQTEVLTFLGDRISESLSGEVSPVAIGVFGNDLDELDALARRVADVLRRVPGAAAVRVQESGGLPVVAIDPRPEALLARGVRGTDLLDAVQAAYQGISVAQVHTANRTLEVTVTLAPSKRDDPETLGRLLLRTPDGVTVALDELAELAVESRRASVLHEGGRRRQVITAHPTTRDVGGFVDRARAAVAREVELPPGTYLEWAGAAAGAASAQRQLLIHGAAAAAGIFALLMLVFGNLRSVLLVLGTAPFALVGGVAAVALGGGTLSIGSLVGFVTLFGVAARNAILLLAHLDHLVTEEGHPWNRETVLLATRERLVPIVMTALVTLLGLAPLALATGEAGREVQGPMAQVILGGLVTSTALTLWLLPTLILRHGRRTGAIEGG